jgi:hypothetical protein
MPDGRSFRGGPPSLLEAVLLKSVAERVARDAKEAGGAAAVAAGLGQCRGEQRTLDRFERDSASARPESRTTMTYLRGVRRRMRL